MKRLFLLIFVLISTACAQARVYQIEMIIFSHLTRQSLTQEQWPLLNVADFNINRGVTLQTADMVANPSDDYVLLPARDYLLKRTQQRLDKQPPYKTIAHLAWRQTVVSPQDADTIHLTEGKTYGNDQYQLQGNIRISVKRYLNVSFNLLFAEPTSELTTIADNADTFANQGKLTYFHLAQTRRMRSKELNYIDFPLYGILIKITPVKVS